MIALALWLATSILVGCVAGRFIRVGMVDRVADEHQAPGEDFA